MLIVVVVKYVFGAGVGNLGKTSEKKRKKEKEKD
tara:strand:+ start:763 stop:864 length:102 start_codon:yes stop_codon:yes gene_type:complete